MTSSQGRLKKMLRSIPNLLGAHVCFRRKPAAEKESDEKLLNIFNELTVGISEVFESKPQAFDEYLRCDKVSCKISVLSEQIGQVRILHSLWKNGYDLNPQELVAKLQSLNLLVDCIRDDVFYAYLQLPPQQKLHLLKKNKQVSAIFAVLGTLENEVTEMLKTVFPNEELLKAIRPLLKPNFNRAVYKRQANFYSYDAPSYQTMQLSCKKVTYSKPKTVDAWTDPIDQEDWDYDDLLRNRTRFAVKDLEPIHRANQTETPTVESSNASCQVSFDEDIGLDDDYLIMENTVRLTEMESQDGQLPLETNGVKDMHGRRISELPQRDLLSCSQECLRDKGGSLDEQDQSFWKIAADLIADQPAS